MHRGLERVIEEEAHITVKQTPNIFWAKTQWRKTASPLGQSSCRLASNE